MAEYKDGLSFSSSEMKAIYIGNSSEAHVTVSSDRTMYVEEDSYIAGIVGDHNSNPVRIRCDRYVDGGDLTECNKFYIAWQNPTAEISGRSEINDISVDPDNKDKLLCTWLVDHDTCSAAGTIEITFQAIKQDTDATILYEWQTQLNDSMQVLAGINGSYSYLHSGSNSIKNVDSVYGIDSEELVTMLEEVLA